MRGVRIFMIENNDKTKKNLFIYFFFVYMGTSIIGEILGLSFIIELIIWFVLMEIGDLFYKKMQRD